MAQANINVDASATEMILTGLRRYSEEAVQKKKKEKVPKISALGFVLCCS